MEAEASMTFHSQYWSQFKVVQCAGARVCRWCAATVIATVHVVCLSVALYCICSICTVLVAALSI